jgi:hypothetical protein
VPHGVCTHWQRLVLLICMTLLLLLLLLSLLLLLLLLMMMHVLAPQPNMSDPITIAQTAAFTLHSRPSASKKIFLDFDGHVTTGTAWNTAKPTITTPRYDTIRHCWWH